ncbi:MAG TPA: HEAT repeat domain-containing protein [Gemmatimonadaceae bacterium]|nr:HEAT repeat domain-containing protein [Gemmatimonadaceae bacterium]
MRFAVALITSLALCGSAHRALAQDARAASTVETSYNGVALSEWVRQLDDRSPSARIHAAYVIAELGPAAAQAVPALRLKLGDADPVMRYAAVWALSEIGTAARVALPELAAHAEDDEVGDVRWIAAKALRKLGVTDARPGQPVTLPPSPPN